MNDRGAPAWEGEALAEPWSGVIRGGLGGRFAFPAKSRQTYAF
jgi:hypothetical protein